MEVIFLESILISIKKLLGISEDYTIFDNDIIIHINSVFSILHQMGFPGYSIESKDENWDDYIALVGNDFDVNDVRSYVFFKTRMMFDPPTGAAADSYNNLIGELEWRLTNELVK